MSGIWYIAAVQGGQVWGSYVCVLGVVEGVPSVTKGLVHHSLEERHCRLGRETEDV